MKLRLAEYKDGKFERFLELGSDFGYFGDFILVSNDYEQDFRAEYTPISDTELDGSCGSVDPTAERFALDKKDPLNRFNGLFDGRTYGEGRFVLVKDGEDDVKTILGEAQIVEILKQQKAPPAVPDDYETITV